MGNLCRVSLRGEEMSNKVKLTFNKKKVLKELDKSIESSLSKVGDMIVNDARSMVPVKTGKLKKSIYKNVEKNKLEVGASADYAQDIELGTSGRKAKPFLKPAVNKNKSSLEKITSAELKSRLGR